VPAYGQGVYGAGVYGMGVAGESCEQLLAQLTGQVGDQARQIYAKWAGLTIPTNGETLEQLVRYKLNHSGVGAKITASAAESLLLMLQQNGAAASAETVEEALLKTGLTGWS
jgi:hypothetical protein